MPNNKLTIPLSLACLALTAETAHAYIGPSLGAGTIAVILGILASIAMAFVAFLWYPVKRLGKKLRRSKAGAESPESSQRS